MKTSESINNVMVAIQAVQQNAGTVQKASQGQVGTRIYQYANLNDTWEAVKGLLAQNNLVIVQSPSTGETAMGQFFTTTIYHTPSSEWIEETMLMTLQKNDPQGIGAAITYYRRYMVTSMLGLIPDDDNDAREQRLATAEQKRKIIGAVKLAFPDISKPEDIVSTVQSIAGKYPGNIREDEAEDVLSLIKAFNTNKE